MSCLTASTAVSWDGTGAVPDGLRDVEFLVPPYGARAFDATQLAGMPRLQVIQLLSAGAEPWLPVRPPGVTLCNARGVHGASTAELAVAGMSSVLRELPAMFAAQRERADGRRATPTHWSASGCWCSVPATSARGSPLR